jgi:hypothetical protein
MAGAPRVEVAPRWFFVSVLFENLVTEEICGRFGPVDGSTGAYRPARVSAR